MFNVRPSLLREDGEVSGPSLWPLGRNLSVTTTISAITNNSYKRLEVQCMKIVQG